MTPIIRSADDALFQQLLGEAAGARAIVIDTDPLVTTTAGGTWWDVAVPEVSERKEVVSARKAYETGMASQRVGH